MTTTIIRGDCVEAMRRLSATGLRVDSIVTDPPDHLKSIVERFGAKDAAPAKFGRDGAFVRQSKGFMGKTWDGGDVAADPETWRQAYNIIKPGGYLLAFGGTRTFHRMACAIEDAGFDIRDCLMWMYGTGFPKSHAVGLPGWDGWGTALKPAWEPIIMARRPHLGTIASNVLEWGVGGINIDGCRVPLPDGDWLHDGITGRDGRDIDTADNEGLWGFKAVDRKAGMGRWPANVIHDGSDEVEDSFAAYGEHKACMSPSSAKPEGKILGGRRSQGNLPQDSGSISRYFYCAKANKNDRAGSTHPTVKPVALMRYLVRLVTPPDGLVLDPFAGSGTTLQAAVAEGFRALGMEMEEQYVGDIVRRLRLTD